MSKPTAPRARGLTAGVRGGRQDPVAAAAAAAPAAAAPPPAPVRQPVGGTRPRPQGTTRVAVDVPAELGEAFRDRAKNNSYRFTQSEALQAALSLLAELPDEQYNELLLRFR